MSAQKKQERDRDKEKDKKTSNKKDTPPEEPNIKDVLAEITKLHLVIQNIQTKQDTQNAALKEELKEMKKDLKESQDTQNATLKEELKEMKKDLKEELHIALKREMNETREDITRLKQENNELKKENENFKEQQLDLRKKLKTMEGEISSLTLHKETQEFREKEHQLRFRNIIEEDNENIREIIMELILPLCKTTPDIIGNHLDRVLRINSNYAKKNKVPRDVLVFFTKRATRDAILRENAKSPIMYKGNKIAILKETPITVLERRRKYRFLTDELNRRNVRFRWAKT
ncbi:uncharacterized protein PF3D7_1120000-like [Anolis sagrei]|uniref:uncharacterized protein PF3D7_1120000-like n=1 Tax=Anolis sagrei TaxID=38937 RepID=UPI0035204792